MDTVSLQRPSHMPQKTRILIVSDSPLLPTGMAETTRVLFSALIENYREIYDVHQIGLFHCYAVCEPKWPVLPTQTTSAGGGGINFDVEDIYAQRTFPRVFADLQPDLVFAYNDPQKLLHICDHRRRHKYRLVVYVNFDGLPMTGSEGFRALFLADRVVTLSQFSRRVVQACAASHGRDSNLHPGNCSDAQWIYSPADTDRFRPVAAAEKEALRRYLLPSWAPRDAFVLGWVGRNQWRKQVWILYPTIHYIRTGMYWICHSCKNIDPLEWDPVESVFRWRGVAVGPNVGQARAETCLHCGLSPVTLARPLENALLWLHMARDDPDAAWSPTMLECQFDVRPGRDIHYTDHFAMKAALPPDAVPVLYQIWDALLYPSGGEGFGNPCWEAMASELPIIYTEYSGHAELVSSGQAGIPVGGQLQPEAFSGIWRMVADIGKLISAILQLYHDRTLRSQLGRNGRNFVLRYTPSMQAAKWHEMFSELVSRKQV